MSVYAIRFDFPDSDAPIYAGDYNGAAGFAPTLATALVFADADGAVRFLRFAYSDGLVPYGRVVTLEDRVPR
jgi:hypothetical protein